MPSPAPFSAPRRSFVTRLAYALPLAAPVAALAVALSAGIVPRAHAAEPANAPAHVGAIDLTPYAGSVVYVDFWASWCVPCRASFPWMNALQAELADDGFVVIGVNTADDPEAAARFLEEVPAEFTLMDDPDGTIAEAYGLTGMPMAFVHDRDGALVASHVGFNERAAERHAEEIRAFVRRER